MNKFKFYFILLITTVSIFSCDKDDDNNYTPEPPRDYQTQYDADIAVIEEYLKTNYLKMDLTDPNFADKDVVISTITDPATQPSLMSYLNASTFPKLKSKTVKQDGINYTLYYLVLREGTGDSPCNVDGVFTAYEGSYLYRTVAPASVVTPVGFEKETNPSEFLSLFELITGWGEVFPEFKKGTRSIIGDGTVTYNDFGAGVMFLPSGLAYYNQVQASIPVYSPLVFSFKLYDVQRLDQDNDGIPSYLEDLNNDGYMRVLPATSENRYVDDTDQDGFPDFYDKDDDGDNYTTRLEITKPNGSNLELDGPSLYYPFDPIISYPSKATDEKRGIPAYSATGNPDYTSPDRLRIHLDKEHHTAQ